MRRVSSSDSLSLGSVCSCILLLCVSGSRPLTCDPALGVAVGGDDGRIPDAAEVQPVSVVVVLTARKRGGRGFRDRERAAGRDLPGPTVTCLTSPISSAWTLETPWKVRGLCTHSSGAGSLGVEGPKAWMELGTNTRRPCLVAMSNMLWRPMKREKLRVSVCSWDS